MASYTLKIYCGDRELERFNHRSAQKLRTILEHPKNHRSGQLGPWGEIESNADRFEIFDSVMEKLFVGNIADALNFVGSLR